MSWPTSVVVGVLTAIVACLLAGAVAGLAVDWYRISSFEGKSGYFVVAFALLGLIAGLVIGLVTSRVMAGATHPFLESLGEAVMIVVIIAGVIAGVARLSADVAPRLAGDELLLDVEVRWPASQKESPAADTTPRRLRLYSLAGRTTRTNAEGPLWMEDAHLVDGRWVVPGAVEVFTSRGGRMLTIQPPFEKAIGFEIPLPAWPKRAQLAWSEWMPRARPGAAPLPDGFTMRFKVQPRSQPVRTQTFGPFEIATIASGFYEHATDDDHRGVAASAKFLIGYRGTSVTFEGSDDDGSAQKFDRAESVALLPGAPDALLVRAGTEVRSGPVYLVVADGDRVRTELVSTDAPQGAALLVTNDVARFRRVRSVQPVPGTVDRESYAEPGDFLFGGALLSTRPPVVRRFHESTDTRLDPNARPVGISPDARRFVRVGFAEDYKSRELVVTDAQTGGSSFVPIDAKATRVGEVSDLDPEWLAHYYAWVRGADGQQRLEPRANVKPLPYRGTFSVPTDGYREYHVQPAGDAMFGAFTAWLASEVGATRTPEDVAASGYQVHVDGQLVHVMNRDDYHQVGIYNERGSDPRVVTKVGERFDAALATGRYDSLFLEPPPIQ